MYDWHDSSEETVRLGDIDIPDRLLDASSDKRLVIFAGAGVSMPPPSSLPDFEGLIREIERLSQCKRLGAEGGDPEDPDVFLGRVEAAGFPVHQQIAKRFAASAGAPNPVHHSIVGLFQESSSVRVVTTNYDRHLSQAARERWQCSLPEARAPALPLGDDFGGIVYLHGDIEGAAKELVLTDSDFGKAYLTRGYARRFLVDCFRAYSVLFVGYSCNDRVFSYLLRGLPPSLDAPPRFALVPSGEEERWRSLGITPLPYDPAPIGDEPHAELRESLEHWAQYAQMGFMDHSVRIASIASGAPADCDAADLDYLRRCFAETTTTEFFCRGADDPAWLRWLESEPAFVGAMEGDASEGSPGEVLSRWFAGMALSAPDATRATIARLRKRIPSRIWLDIVGELWRKHPPAEVLLAWLPLLFSSVPHFKIDLLGYLLKDCRPDDDDAAARLLFSFLTEPSAVMRPYPDISEPERFGVELFVHAPDYFLYDGLQSVLLPRLETFGRDLLATATRNLERGHELLSASGQADEAYDELSFGRSAIEPHEQDQQGQPDWVDALVDGARSAMEWAMESDPVLARGYIAVWSKSRAPLLRRLAAHAEQMAPWLEADEKLAGVVEEDALFETALHHEIYVLLASVYPNATPDGREPVLDCLAAGLPAETYPNHEDLADYVVFSLLAWLHDAAPTDERLALLIRDMQQRHPDFKADREHPDMTHWMEIGGWTAPPSPLSAEELLQRAPEDDDFVKALLAFLSEGEDLAHGSRKRSLLHAVTEACIKDLEWALRLGDSFSARNLWRSDLWAALIDGWKNATLSEEQWLRVFDLLGTAAIPADLLREIARLLEDALRARPVLLPVAVLGSLKSLLDKLMRTAREGQPHTPWDGANWFERALNEPGGQLAECFIQTLGLERLEDADQQGVPADYRAQFEAIASGETDADALGRAILAAHLGFLHSIDADWSSEVPITLLRWHEGGPDPASWSGFLASARLTPALLTALLPVYEAAAPHIEELGDRRHAFAEHVALAALLADFSLPRTTWLLTFLRSASSDDVVAWTRRITQELRHMTSEGRSGFWRTWLKDYWVMRCEDVPKSVSAEESAALLEWAVLLPEDFEEVCQCACSMQVKEIDGAFYYEMHESGLAKAHPPAAARLLRHALEADARPFYACREALAIAADIVRSGTVEHDDVQAINSALLGLGCVPADS